MGEWPSLQPIMIWVWIAATIVFFMGLYWSLKSPRRRAVILGLMVAVSAIIAYWLYFIASSWQLAWLDFITLVCIGLTCGSACLMLAVRDAIYTALSFAVSLVAIAGIFLMYGAEFLMAATIIIYSGAIVVIFLFVIMLAQQAGPVLYDSVPREPFLSCVAGLILTLSLSMPVIGKALKEEQRQKARHQKDSVSAAWDVCELETLALKALQSLETIRKAAQSSEPQERLVNLLENKNSDGLSLMDCLERLSTPLRLTENQVLALRKRIIHASYNDLLACLTEKPLDYERMDQVTAKLESAVAELLATIRGHQAVTRIEGRTSVRELGGALFSYYSAPVQLAGWLLLIATIGTYLIGAWNRQPDRESA